MKDQVTDFKEVKLSKEIACFENLSNKKTTDGKYTNNVILLSEFRKRYGYDENQELTELDFEKEFINRANEEYSWSTAFLVSLLIIYFIATSSGALYYLYFA